MDVSAVIQSATATILAAALIGLARFLRSSLAGISGKLLDGNDVVDCAERHADRLARLVLDFLDLACSA